VFDNAATVVFEEDAFFFVHLAAIRRQVGLNGLGHGVGQDRAFFSPKPDGEWQEMPCLICILSATFRSVFVVLPPNFL